MNTSKSSGPEQGLPGINMSGIDDEAGGGPRPEVRNSEGIYPEKADSEEMATLPHLKLNTLPPYRYRLLSLLARRLFEITWNTMAAARGEIGGAES